MSARESDVERFLRGYGKVRDISLKRGYGFVVRRILIVPWRFAMKSFFSFHGLFCDLLSLYYRVHFICRSLMITEMLTTLLQI